MNKRPSTVTITCILLIAGLSFFTFITSTVTAASRVWTTDIDFNEPGAIFLATEVIGTGVNAKVELLKDNTDWRNMNPPGPPGARESPAAVFSPQGNKTVLFGGYNVFYLDDTWEYDYPINMWTKISTNPHPIGREFHKMAYDSREKVVVLFGGINGTIPDIYLTDTWEYDVVTQTWENTNSSGPMMASSALAYDAIAQKHILVGLNLTTQVIQTWAYDTESNTWSLRTSGVPSKRSGHALTYHEQLQRIVLFGGVDPSVPPGTFLSDTWEYNYASNSWSQVSVTGPAARQAHSMSYRPASKSILLFGGQGSSSYLQDTWRYTDARRWEVVSVTTSPPIRTHAAFTYDTKADVGVLFGGRDPGYNPLGDTWVLGASYRAAGKYASAVFDGTCGNVDWQSFWWNKSTQPPNTFLRFQLATSDVQNPSSWNYVGPTGTVSSYYTTPGQTLWTGHDNHRFLRFLGDFGSFDTQATPSMEDVTIHYNCPPTPPYIVNTDPAHMARDIPLLKPINVTFSEAMDKSTVSWQFLLGQAIPLAPQWSLGDTFLSLTHTQPFQENTVYRIQIFGKDMDGNDLVPNPVNPSVVNPWLFTTIRTYPYIAKATPAQGDSNVALDANITVDFSEPMNTSSVKWSIAPNMTLTPEWSNGDARLTLSHLSNFSQCIGITVEITEGEDKAKVPLIPGPVHNPWSFTTICINPYIVVTYPWDLMTDVAYSSPIYVNFSEPMDISTVTWTVIRGVPVTFNPTWSDSNRRLKLSHAQNFLGCVAYEIKIDGKDVDGNELIPGPPPWPPPNPWSFMTVCGNPYLHATNPADGKKNVSIGQEIQIAFSESMNNNSVKWTITPSVMEGPPFWDPNNVFLRIPHAGFQQCTKYTVHVTDGRSSGGLPLIPGLAPNPFSFEIICEAPYIVSTDPADGEMLVPLDKDIVVEFSEPMIPASLFFTITPDVAGKSYLWSNNNQTLTVTHTTNFIANQTYQVFVFGSGADGNELIIPGPIVPDPWIFTTRAPGFYIVSTDPRDKATDVPLDKNIIVQFSEPANPGSFSVSSVPIINLTPQWSNADQTVTLNHTDFFLDCTIYTITVNAWDKSGNPLITVPGSAPNPWTFKTICLPPLDTPGGLHVTRMPPNNVLLTWRLVTGASSYVVYSSLSKFASWPWPQLIEVTTTSYLVANHLSDGMSHFYIVRAKNGIRYSTNSTMGAIVPLTFPYAPLSGNTHWLSLPYRTMYQRASDISNELTSALINVVAKWNPSTQSPILWFYFRGVWRGTDFTINPGDGLYIGVQTSFTWVINGTDRSVTLSFNLNSPLIGNVNWISLPYTSTYTRASDIVFDIEGSLEPGANTKIVEVAKWDRITQTLIRYSYTSTGWSGTNFNIAAGDGIYLRIVSSFTWTPKLITPEVP